MIFYLALLTWPRISRGWRVTGWTVLAGLAFTEAYTRIFLIKHWLMDVLGGWIFGSLLLMVFIGSAYALEQAIGFDSSRARA